MSQKIQKLVKIARVVRADIVGMVCHAKSGHPGGSLSATELVVALYFDTLRIKPFKPYWTDRDRFILSKGHCSPLIYSVLARRGFFPVEELSTFRRFHSRLQGHPDMAKTPGIDMTTGSLGNGLSAGLGMALAGRLDKKNYFVWVLLGDGEIQEGCVWEAAMAASHYHVNNLIAIVDYNGLQVDGYVHEIMDIKPVIDKWRAFGWETYEIDGHDFVQILSVYNEAKRDVKGPKVIIAHTTKGKGISFMEDKVDWHGKAPTEEELKICLSEIVVKE